MELYGEFPPKRGTFVKLQVYRKMGIFKFGDIERQGKVSLGTTLKGQEEFLFQECIHNMGQFLKSVKGVPLEQVFNGVKVRETLKLISSSLNSFSIMSNFVIKTMLTLWGICLNGRAPASHAVGTLRSIPGFSKSLYFTSQLI